MKKNLVLTGMMGVGKSTVGRRLAKKLSFDFIDVDKVIEEKEKSSINEIFKTKGEIYFRKIEDKITKRELKNINSIIALGGGAFMDRSIRREIGKYSTSFWLDTKLDILINRLSNSKNRPLLTRNNLGGSVRKIYFERKKTYIKADFRVMCGSLKPEQIAKKILELYNGYKN